MGEEAIEKFVARYGPVAIGLFADQLRQYQSGIFDSDSCVAAEPNHGVLAVGYGTDPQFGDYWLVVSVDSLIGMRVLVVRAEPQVSVNPSSKPNTNTH
jgi:hypothetical protein